MWDIDRDALLHGLDVVPVAARGARTPFEFACEASGSTAGVPCGAVPHIPMHMASVTGRTTERERESNGGRGYKIKI